MPYSVHLTAYTGILTGSVRIRFNNHVLCIFGNGATSESDEGGERGALLVLPEQSVFCQYILTHPRKAVFGEGITRTEKYFLSDFENLEVILLSSTITAFQEQASYTFAMPKVRRIKQYK
ncbi:MAG: hypothetical protein ACI4O7_13780 [Aristaeellaceae bacterium]